MINLIHMAVSDVWAVEQERVEFELINLRLVLQILRVHNVGVVTQRPVQTTQVIY